MALPIVMLMKPLPQNIQPSNIDMAYINLDSWNNIFLKNSNELGNWIRFNNVNTRNLVFSKDWQSIIYINNSDSWTLYKKSIQDLDVNNPWVKIATHTWLFDVDESPDGKYIIYSNWTNLFKKNSNDFLNGSQINISWYYSWVDTIKYTPDNLYILYSNNERLTAVVYRKNANDISDWTKITGDNCFLISKWWYCSETYIINTDFGSRFYYRNDWNYNTFAIHFYRADISPWNKEYIYIPSGWVNKNKIYKKNISNMWDTSYWELLTTNRASRVVYSPVYNWIYNESIWLSLENSHNYYTYVFWVPLGNYILYVKDYYWNKVNINNWSISSPQWAFTLNWTDNFVNASNYCKINLPSLVWDSYTLYLIPTTSDV